MDSHPKVFLPFFKDLINFNTKLEKDGRQSEKHEDEGRKNITQRLWRSLKVICYQSVTLKDVF